MVSLHRTIYPLGMHEACADDVDGGIELVGVETDDSGVYNDDVDDSGVYNY